MLAQNNFGVGWGVCLYLFLKESEKKLIPCVYLCVCVGEGGSELLRYSAFFFHKFILESSSPFFYRIKLMPFYRYLSRGSILLLNYFVHRTQFDACTDAPHIVVRWRIAVFYLFINDALHILKIQHASWFALQMTEYTLLYSILNWLYLNIYIF